MELKNINNDSVISEKRYGKIRILIHPHSTEKTIQQEVTIIYTDQPSETKWENVPQYWSHLLRE